MRSNPSSIRVEAIRPPSGTLASEVFAEPDYSDCFLVTRVTGVEFDDVDDVATAYFRGQPRWLSLVSMGIGKRETIDRVVREATYEAGSTVGTWKVFARSADEILFGDDMGFMEYRFSLRLVPHQGGQAVEASTVVRYRSPRSSHVYFTAVKPFHRRFVPISLRALGAPPDQCCVGAAAIGI